MKRLLAGFTLAFLVVASPANADHCHYPPKPDKGHGSVDENRVDSGECVLFSGDGFLGNAVIEITDNGVVVPGVHKTASDGSFEAPVCFTGADAVGQHSLAARGPKGPPEDPPGHCGNPKAERLVAANVTVAGVRQGGPGGNGSAGQPGGVAGEGFGRPLPRTGDLSGAELMIGSLLVLFGLAVLLAGKPRRRRTEAPAQ
jgi:hypothetical protein